jgi:transcriptional regulator with XRE-family HTH domain
MPSEVYAQVGEAIRRKREARGMTQATLASKVDLARTSITNIEAGAQALQLHHFLLIAAALSAAPADLLPGRIAPILGREAGSATSDQIEALLEKLTDQKHSGQA